MLKLTNVAIYMLLQILWRTLGQMNCYLAEKTEDQTLKKQEWGVAQWCLLSVVEAQDICVSHSFIWLKGNGN